MRKLQAKLQQSQGEVQGLTSSSANLADRNRILAHDLAVSVSSMIQQVQGWPDVSCFCVLLPLRSCNGNSFPCTFSAFQDTPLSCRLASKPTQAVPLMHMHSVNLHHPVWESITELYATA